MSLQQDLAWQQLDLTYRASVAHQLARYALGLTARDVPAEVVHQAKRCVLDALGCAIGAYEAPGRTICEAVVAEIGGPPEATVFCSGTRTSALNAALVNSFLVRFLDFNDVGGGGHNSDAIPSILAVAEREGATGLDVLTAVIVSYELGSRFGDSILSSLEPKGWTKDIRAGLIQPPALGRLMGLAEEQIANAIGICLSHALPLGILDAHREEHVMAKNIRFGWAAHDAILACMLAKRGFTGPVRIVESDAGVRQVVIGGDMDLEKLTDFSGWRILDTRFKSMAANGTTQAHVFATMAIVSEHDLTPADIQAVNIRASVRESRHTTTFSKKYPRNAESADHSAFFANAVAIRDREFGPDSVRPENFIDPVVLELIERITVRGDPDYPYWQGSSEIITKDGRRFERTIDKPHGFGDDPLSDDELEAKFRKLAIRHLPEDQVDRLVGTCWQLDRLDDLGQLMALTTFPS